MLFANCSYTEEIEKTGLLYIALNPQLVHYSFTCWMSSQLFPISLQSFPQAVDVRCYLSGERGRDGVRWYLSGRETTPGDPKVGSLPEGPSFLGQLQAALQCPGYRRETRLTVVQPFSRLSLGTNERAVCFLLALRHLKFPQIS